MLMLTDKQEKTFQKLKAGELTPREKADFYFRLSGILNKSLKELEDLTQLLNELPDSYLEKIDLRQTAIFAMKLTEKLLEKIDPIPIVYPGGKAVKDFMVNQQSYIPGITELKVIHELSYTPTKEEHVFFDQFGAHIRALQELASPVKSPHKYIVYTPEEAVKAIDIETKKRGLEEYTQTIKPIGGNTQDELLMLNALLHAKEMGHPVPESSIKALMKKLGIQEEPPGDLT